MKKGGIYRPPSSKEELAAEVFDYAWRPALDARLTPPPVQSFRYQPLRRNLLAWIWFSTIFCRSPNPSAL